MFSSPCHLPDTLFHLIYPGFCEVAENLASGWLGNLPESHSEQVAGRGFHGCLTLLKPLAVEAGVRRFCSPPTAPPQAHGVLSSEGTPQKLLRAADSPPTGPDPAWWETDATPPPHPFPSHLNYSYRPDQAWAGCGDWAEGGVGRLACPPTRSVTPLSIQSCWPPWDMGLLSCRWGN